MKIKSLLLILLTLAVLSLSACIVIEQTPKYITFADENGITIKTVESIATDEFPDAPEKDGYRFDKWDKNLDNIRENITVKPIYIKIWTVIFETESGEELKRETVDNGTSATPPQVSEKVGYRFDKWDKNFDNVRENITVKPIYIKVWTVIFETESGEELKRETVDNGTSATPPQVSEKEDFVYVYTFDKWSGDWTQITAETTLKPEFTKKFREYETDKYILHGRSDEETFVIAKTKEDAEFSGYEIMPSTYDSKQIVGLKENSLAELTSEFIFVPTSYVEFETIGLETSETLKKIYTDADNVATLKTALPSFAEKIFAGLIEEKGFLTAKQGRQINNQKELLYYFEEQTFNLLSEFDAQIMYDDFVFDGTTSYLLNNCAHDFCSSLRLGMQGDVLTFEVEYRSFPEKVASETDAYVQKKAEMHYLKTQERAQDYNDFYIEKVSDVYHVSNSEQLFYVLTKDIRPEIETGSAAETIYLQAKEILRKIISNSMDDFEKAHAIYDYIIDTVVYDAALLDKFDDSTGEDLKKYRGFYLEGVFGDHRAVCDGISKAFAVLCRIEGIKAIQVEGYSKSSGVGHAWNKVYINGEWYVVDATAGGTIFTDSDDSGMEVLTHKYLFMNQTEADKYNTERGEYPVATGSKNVYADYGFTYLIFNCDYIISSKNELEKAVNYFKTSEYETVDMKIDFIVDNFQYILNFSGSYSYNDKILILIK